MGTWLEWGQGSGLRSGKASLGMGLEWGLGHEKGWGFVGAEIELPSEWGLASGAGLSWG